LDMRPFGRLIPVSIAQQRLRRAVRPITRTERVPLAASLGRVASVTVGAPAPVPAFARATWDGYALRSRETRGASPDHPLPFRVVGEVYAEQAYAGAVGRNEAVAIATGGAIPRGLDAVVIFEKVRLDDRTIYVSGTVRRHGYVASPGEDFPKGYRIVRQGQVLAPADLGGLASIGRTEVPVYARPSVAILPNGNELRVPGEALRPGQIYESNNFTLGTIVQAGGGIPTTRPPISDDPDRIEEAIRAALKENDLVVLTGGSSVGERDFLPAVFPRLGKVLFHGVAVRPGKPTLAVLAGRKLVIGMPGHPTSCLANGFWLLLPLVRRLARLPGSGTLPLTARLGSDYLAPSPGLSTVIPLRLVGGRAYPTFRDSSAITSLSGANAFSIVGPRKRLSRGTRLMVHRLLPPLAPE
jgi:molybdopterin molybdotransferase